MLRGEDLRDFLDLDKFLEEQERQREEGRRLAVLSVELSATCAKTAISVARAHSAFCFAGAAFGLQAAQRAVDDFTKDPKA